MCYQPRVHALVIFWRHTYTHMLRIWTTAQYRPTRCIVLSHSSLPKLCFQSRDSAPTQSIRTPERAPRLNWGSPGFHGWPLPCNLIRRNYFLDYSDCMIHSLCTYPMFRARPTSHSESTHHHINEGGTAKSEQGRWAGGEDRWDYKERRVCSSCSLAMQH